MSNSHPRSSIDSDSAETANQNCTNVDIINNNGSMEPQELEDEQTIQSDMNSDSLNSSEDVAHSSRPDLTLNLKSSFSESEMKCLLCSYSHPNAEKIEEHINRVHFDATSPCVSNDGGDTSNFKCPFCSLAFNQSRYLEAHVNVAHDNIVSPQKVNVTFSRNIFISLALIV